MQGLKHQASSHHWTLVQINTGTIKHQWQRGNRWSPGNHVGIGVLPLYKESGIQPGINLPIIIWKAQVLGPGKPSFPFQSVENDCATVLMEDQPLPLAPVPTLLFKNMGKNFTFHPGKCNRLPAPRCNPRVSSTDNMTTCFRHSAFTPTCQVDLPSGVTHEWSNATMNPYGIGFSNQ